MAVIAYLLFYCLIFFFLILECIKIFQEPGHFDPIPVVILGHILYGHNQTSFYPPILMETILQHTISSKLNRENPIREKWMLTLGCEPEPKKEATGLSRWKE